MPTEEEKALQYRRDLQKRKRYRLLQERLKAGDAAARRELEKRWEPLKGQR